MGTGSKLLPNVRGVNLVQFLTLMLKFLNWTLRNKVLSEFVYVIELYCVLKKLVCQKGFKCHTTIKKRINPNNYKIDHIHVDGLYWEQMPAL